MLMFLLNPWIRNAIIGLGVAFACVLGYAYWAGREKAIGAATEKAREEAIAIQHEQKVDAAAAAVDQIVSQDQSPQDTLNKQWSQP